VTSTGWKAGESSRRDGNGRFAWHADGDGAKALILVSRRFFSRCPGSRLLRPTDVMFSKRWLPSRTSDHDRLWSLAPCALCRYSGGIDVSGGTAPRDGFQRTFNVFQESHLDETRGTRLAGIGEFRFFRPSACDR
jgi:hypothetical protein